MRSILLIFMFAVLTPLSACADDPAEPKNAPIVHAAIDESNTYYLVNGEKLRLAEEGEQAASVADGSSATFRDMASLMAMIQGISEEEALKLNGWTEVADERVPAGHKFWVHPSLRTR